MSTKRPMVSVCMATYNGEKYLKEQIDSILSQLQDGDELVISDDGSSDATLDIIAQYADDRIKVFHHDSSSITTKFHLDKPTHNFENAINNSKGDIIFLSDQDDVWLEGKVDKMLDALQTYDFAVHDCKLTDQDLKPYHQSYFEYIGIHRGVIANIIKATYPGCCMAMRRKVAMAAMPFPKTKVGHDLWLGLVADKKFKTTLVREPLSLFRRHGNNSSPSGNKSPYGFWFKINYRLTVVREILNKKIR